MKWLSKTSKIVFFLLLWFIPMALPAHGRLVFNVDFAQDGRFEKLRAIEPGETVSVDIYVSNVPKPGLINMGFILEYDAAKLEVLSAGVDTQTWPDLQFVDTGNPGQIDMSGARIEPPPIFGMKIKLGTVRFQGLEVGRSELLLLDRPGDWFVVATEPGTALDGDIGDGVVLAQILCRIAGDVNGSGVVDLADGILALKVLARMNPGGVQPFSDANNDGRIGLHEAVYILQKVAEIR